MAAMFLLPGPAMAEFRYLSPATPRPSFVAVAPADPAALGQVLRRLAPRGIRLRFDRRVDADTRVDRRYEDWKSLLFGEGLAGDRHGDEIHVRPAGVASGGIELVAADRGRSEWTVHAGETLRGVLTRWCEWAGIEVVVLTDRRYRVHSARTFRGTFREVTAALLVGLSHMPHPPAAELSADGGVLSVMHRSRSLKRRDQKEKGAGEEETKR